MKITNSSCKVKAGNTSKNLLNETRLIIYSLHRAKEITKKLYNNTMNSTKLKNRMDTIFRNSGNSKTSDRQRLLLKLLDKINLKRKDKCVALSNLSIYYTWKNIKKSYKTDKFKMSSPTWNEWFKLPNRSHSASGIQETISSISSKNMSSYWQSFNKNIRK